jgi:3-dehydroquinate dehydratase-2
MTGGTRNRVEVLHGVNLSMLGKRDARHYGTLTLIELEVRIRHWARELGLETSFFNTNSEADFIERLHQAPQVTDALILNPGAWTHYSYAIRDAVEIADVPTIEVHLSDVDQREDWRRVSVLSGLVQGRVVGKGPDGYHEALQMLAQELGVEPPAAA